MLLLAELRVLAAGIITNFALLLDGQKRDFQSLGGDAMGAQSSSDSLVNTQRP